MQIPRRLASPTVLAQLALAGVLLAAACRAPAGGRDGTSPAASPVIAATPPPATAVPATVTPAATPPPAEATTAPAATRVGAEYVLLLPREAAVPSDWVMNPLPDYEARAPGPDDTYRFACRDLPARSIGAASVGYRHLEGLPSVYIEYVVYPSAEAAATALADMRDAIDGCPAFAIGAGESATDATFAPLDFPPHGDETLAAALATDNPVTGALVTHVLKVRQGHVIIGIAHASDAGADPPDDSLTQALVEFAVANLTDGPLPPQP